MITDIQTSAPTLQKGSELELINGLTLEQIQGMIYAAEEDDRLNRSIPYLAKGPAREKNSGTYKADLLLFGHKKIYLAREEDLVNPFNDRPSDFFQKEGSLPYTYRPCPEPVSGLLNPDDYYINLELDQVFTNGDLMTAGSIASNIVYHIAQSFDALIWEKDEAGRRHLAGVDRAKAQQMLKVNFEIPIALCHTIDYVRTWAEYGAKCGRTFVSNVAKKMRDFGLFQYESKFLSRGDRRHARKYSDVSIPKLLQLILYCEQMQFSMYDMPEHGCAVARELYNALFAGYGYNRRGSDGMPKGKVVNGCTDADHVDHLRAKNVINGEIYVKERAESSDWVQRAIKAWRDLRSKFGEDDARAIRAKEEWQARRAEVPWLRC